MKFSEIVRRFCAFREWMEPTDDGTVYCLPEASLEDLDDQIEVCTLWQDAARYRHLREHGRCDSKHGHGLVLGGRDKASMAFRYWGTPEELDRSVDADMAVRSQ
jgi:hypothetical protein